MRLIELLLASSTIAALLAPPSARACGPDFPPDLLSRRDEVLATLPGGAFAQEVAHLVSPPPGRWRLVEVDPELEPPGARDGAGEQERELYERGATAFHGGRVDEAASAFSAVLALPEAQRRRFSTYAAFMLGRCGRDSAHWFSEVRRLATEGFDDPAGLAVASLGEEARRLLGPSPYTPAGAPTAPRDEVGAVHRYAQQAALGSRRATLSLLFVARALVDEPARLAVALGDPVLQRLITTYAWTRGTDSFWGEPPRSVVPLLEALGAVPGLAGADRLAAAAWSAGRFDIAERFAGVEATPLDAWVRAKLALRAGDTARAEQLLAEAEAGTPADAVWGGQEWRWPLGVRGRLEGERCILALARGDREGALRHALASGSWADLAYVAERVLTVEELKRAVDAGAQPVKAPGVGGPAQDDEGDAWSPDEPAVALRSLLGRRLMREGRRREALPYYGHAAVREQAQSYVVALEAAAEASGVARAERLFEAGSLARLAGLEILGTELGPDWGWAGASYDLTTWSSEKRAKGLATPLISEEERRRATAHAPGHDVRFHYRAVAADHAEAAAALVPQRTQAYAALLCHAARWVRGQDPERVERLWREYVKKGPLVPFAVTFGDECPAPDFERARHAPPKALRLPRRRVLAVWAAGAVGVAVILGLGFRQVRRRGT